MCGCWMQWLGAGRLTQDSAVVVAPWQSQETTRHGAEHAVLEGPLEKMVRLFI